MFKKSLLSFVLLALATQAYGLGLGNLNVNSYLEQPLDISLPLVVTKNDDLNTLIASAASQAEFDGAGILRQSFVDDLTFQVVRKGINPYIKITSKKPIKDPFIHLLIRFKWNSGELLREYTALIDPPVYASESPTPIASPKSVGQDVVKSAPATNSLTSPSDTSTTQTDVSSSQANGLDGETYGPITAGESLSMIAKQIQDRYPDLSIYQIMYVLYRNNKAAFIDDNINQLIKGSLLNVGDTADIRSVDINDGKELFFDHLSRWTENTVSDQQFTGGSSEEVKVSSDGSTGSEAESTTGDNTVLDSTETADSDTKEFKVGSSDLQSASQLSGSSTDAADIALLKQQLAEAESKLSNSVLENNELQERIDLLEDQLADVNKLLELQSTTGSQIVDGLTKAEESEEIVEQKVEEAEAQQNETVTEDTQTETEQLTDPEPVADTPVVTPVPDPVVTPEPAPVVTPAPAPIVVEDKPLSFFDKIKDTLGSSWMYILGALGALLLALIGLAVSRNRRSDSDFEESVSGISDMVLDTKTESTTVSADFKTAETTVTKESSFLTVYSDSEVVVHADEIDPIAEADVYIAYGRDEQGEEVLLEGIRKFPNRPDIKVSLLKLHMKRKDITKFDALAEELYAAGENDNPDIWNKVVEMGAVLSPENPLYSGGTIANSDETSETELVDLDGGAAANATAAIAAAASEAESLLDDEIELGADFDELDLDLDIDSTEERSVDAVVNDVVLETDVDDEIVADVLGAEDDDIVDIEIDNVAEKDNVVDVEIDDVVETVAEKTPTLDESGDVEFENVDFSIGTEVTVNVDDEMSEVSISDDASYDALEEDDLDIASVVEFDNYDQVTEVDVDLSKNDFSERSTQEIVEEAIAKEVTRDEDFEPNIEGAGVDFDEPLSIQLEDVTLDVTADAEIADPNTQLELAKVFVELDDVSGAKEILEALVDTDDADVKKEAVKLLKSLG